MNKVDLNKIVLDEGIDESSLKITESVDYKLDCKNTKDVNIYILKNIKVSLTEIEDTHTDDKVYNYFISDNSTLIINKFYDLSDIKEEINIYLNGYNSNVILNLSMISKGSHVYKINVHHNNKNTNSMTNVHGVTLGSNKIEIENNGYISKGNSNSILNQDNKIIILEDNNSIIKPNLYIDEYDVEASHGAYIGKFNKEEIFYLKSRGLNEDDSYNLLIKGFLLNEFVLNKEDEDRIKQIISKYWR